MNITRHDPQHLRTLSPEYLTVTTIDAQIDELKHRLHGITRTALRQQINEHTKTREELREQGKLRRVIKSILGQHDLHNDLTTLRTPHPTNPDNHTITTDPEQIHNHLTTAHGKIFNTPPHHSNSPLQHPNVDWHRALTDQTYFNSVNSHHNIPQHLLDLIWKGMQAVPNKQSLDTEMTHSFEQPPTLDEFHNAIKHISSNTAPGMSNLTNNEIKSWPDATKLIAYDALSKLWATHTIPSDWQWRWTCLKPKSTDPHLQPEEFRPLTLIDCIRKVWEKIILHRINQIWHKHSTLSPLQHCQRGKGTDSALLQRIAVTEAAQEAALDLYTSSWDFRKAFDSVSKPIIRLAWTRLGVPPDVVEWIASLDEQPNIIHLTPHSQAHWTSHPDHPLDQQYNDHPNPPNKFTAERGVGQGAGLSPATWNALMDILLRSLEILAPKPGLVVSSQDTCYADDLLSPAATLENLQLKADLISAFALIFGLDIASNKLRLHCHLWSGTTPPTQPELTLHGPNWQPTNLPVELSTNKQPLQLKYLGPTFDLDNSSHTLLEYLSTHISNQCNRIITRRASVKTKLTVVQSSTYGRLRYFMPHLTNSLKDLQTKLDKPIEKFYRQLTRNMHSHPNSLLPPPPPKPTPRTPPFPPFDGQPITTTHLPTMEYWSSSIHEQLQLAQLALSRNTQLPHPYPQTLHATLQQHPPPAPHTTADALRALQQYSLQYPADLITHPPPTRTVKHTNHTRIPPLAHIQPTDNTAPLHPGLTITIPDPDNPQHLALAEIIGIHYQQHEPHLLAHIWQTKQQPPHPGSHYTRTHNAHNSTTSAFSTPLNQFLQQLPQPTQIAHLQKFPNPNKATLHHFTSQHIQYHLPNSTRRPPTPPWIAQALNQQLTYSLTNSDAFTDGTFSHHNLDIHSVFHTRPTYDPNPPTLHAAASIVLAPPTSNLWEHHQLL
eukprot:gene17983-20484_t